jgi:Ca2+-binding EF-hand superfamily protein
MKLIKIITAVVMSFGMMVAQPPGQGGNQDGNQGPPPCDEWLNSNMAHDMNGDGVVDEGDCPGAGPPPFQDVDTNDDGKIDREEARAMFGQDEDGNPDPEFDSRFDSRAGDDGFVDQAEYNQADQDGGQPPECDVCGYQFTGPEDHHGHCDKCDHVYTGDHNDRHGHCNVCDVALEDDQGWNDHCNENPEHCRPQAGDTCGWGGQDGGDACGYVFTGDPGEDHHHCDHCGLAVNSGEEMHNHMQADHPDMMEQHDGGGDHDGSGDHDGGPAPTNHWDGNCGAMMNGESEYWLDSDGDGSPDDGPYAVWHEDADGNPVNCGGSGGPPPTCEEVDTNGDGSIDRDEARAKFGQDPQGNPNPNFDQEYDEVDANGDGVVDCDEHDAAVAEGENNN